MVDSDSSESKSRRQGGAEERVSLGLLVSKSIDLPTVPAIAANVIRALENPDTSAADMTRIIQEDQGITARIIKTCNSSLYGLRRTITSLQSAVAMLGFIEVRDLVLACSTRYLYKRFGATEQRLWQHSVAAAVGTRMLATALAPAAKDAAYLAGQMHDLGKVVMNNTDPQKFAAAEEAAKRSGSCEPEQNAFGFTHTDVGALLALQWQLPAAVEAACFYHHDMAMGESIAVEHSGVIACVVLANAMCHRLGFGPEESQESLEVDEQEALKVLGTDEERLKSLTAEFDTDFRKEMSF